MLFPIKISLYNREAEELLLFILNKTTGLLTKPDIRNDLIVCAEYSEILHKNYLKNIRKASKKPYVYKMPLSVVRILHLRLQNHPYSQDLQSVLSKIDQELANMSFKPTPFPNTFL